MAFIASVTARHAVTAPTQEPAASKGFFRMLLDILTEAQTRQAEREIRRFRHLHNISWESNADRPIERRSD
jgi:hypothetical protein